MKKLFTLSLVAFMMVATMCVSSCSTAKSVNKAFEKNGYVMTALTPAQQKVRGILQLRGKPQSAVRG